MYKSCCEICLLVFVAQVYLFGESLCVGNQGGGQGQGQGQLGFSGTSERETSPSTNGAGAGRSSFYQGTDVINSPDYGTPAFNPQTNRQHLQHATDRNYGNPKLCNLLEKQNPQQGFLDWCINGLTSPRGQTSVLTSPRGPAPSGSTLGIQFKTPFSQLQSPVTSPRTLQQPKGYTDWAPVGVDRLMSPRISAVKNSDIDQDVPLIDSFTDLDNQNSNEHGTNQHDKSIDKADQTLMLHESMSQPRRKGGGKDKSFATKPFIDSTILRPDQSDLTQLEPILQGEPLQSANADGFRLVVLDGLTDDVWIMVKKDYPYAGYNVYVEKLKEAEAAKWVPYEGRLFLADVMEPDNLVLYACINSKETVPISIIELEKAIKYERKTCPDGDGTFISTGFKELTTRGAQMDPRIYGTLIWDKVAPTGNFRVMLAPEDDNRFWRSTRRPNGDRRRQPQVGLLAPAGNWKPDYSKTKYTSDIQILQRKMPYLGIYKSAATESDGKLSGNDIVRDGIWFEKPFSMITRFVMTAKPGTMVHGHLFGPQDPNGERYMTIKKDGTYGNIPPPSFVAVEVPIPGTNPKRSQTRIYEYPLKKQVSQRRFIYACSTNRSFLRLGTEADAIQDCGQIYFFHPNFGFYPTYIQYQDEKTMSAEGIEIIFLDDYVPKAIMNTDLDGPDRPTSGRALLIDYYAPNVNKVTMLMELVK